MRIIPASVKPDNDSTPVRADTSLFKSVLTNRNHLLYPIHFYLLLKLNTTTFVHVRTVRHNLTLTRKSCYYDNCNFISRMICTCTDFSAVSICFVAVRFDIALNKHNFILCVCVNTDSADSATVRHIWTLRESYDASLVLRPACL